MILVIHQNQFGKILIFYFYLYTKSKKLLPDVGVHKQLYGNVTDKLVHLLSFSQHQTKLILNLKEGFKHLFSPSEVLCLTWGGGSQCRRLQNCVWKFSKTLLSLINALFGVKKRIFLGANFHLIRFCQSYVLLFYSILQPMQKSPI